MDTVITVEKALTEIREQSIFKSLIPMQAGVGWPVPTRNKGSVYLNIPVFGMQRAIKDQPVFLFPPFATLTVSWPNLVVMEYVNLRWRKPWTEAEFSKPAGTFPHAEIADLSVGQYNEKRTRLLTIIDKILSNNINNEELNEFKIMLKIMMEPSLLPYYRKLYPKYYDHCLPAGL